MYIYANSFDVKNLDKFIGEDPGFFPSSLMVIFLCLQFWCGEWNWGPGRPGGNQSVQPAAVTEPSAAQGLLPVPPRQRLRLVTQVYVPPFLRTEWRVSTATIILTSINFSLFKNVFTSQQICKKNKKYNMLSCFIKRYESFG